MNKNYLQGHLSIQLNFVFDVINTRQKSILTFASESFCLVWWYEGKRQYYVTNSGDLCAVSAMLDKLQSYAPTSAPAS